MAAAYHEDLSRGTLIATRSLSRLRCSDLSLSHREEKYSRTISCQCIFCSTLIEKGLYHCLAQCHAWCTQRTALGRLLGVDLAAHPSGISRAFLRLAPGCDRFTMMASGQRR